MGLARIGWQGEETNSEGRPRLIGTSEFLAPEQAIDSRSVDGRADIYSLGCTLYFLLVGSPPYRGATVTERLAKHQTALRHLTFVNCVRTAQLPSPSWQCA